MRNYFRDHIGAGEDGLVVLAGQGWPDQMSSFSRTHIELKEAGGSVTLFSVSAPSYCMLFSGLLNSGLPYFFPFIFLCFWSRGSDGLLCLLSVRPSLWRTSCSYCALADLSPRTNQGVMGVGPRACGQRQTLCLWVIFPVWVWHWLCLIYDWWKHMPLLLGTA